MCFRQAAAINYKLGYYNRAACKAGNIDYRLDKSSLWLSCIQVRITNNVTRVRVRDMSHVTLVSQDLLPNRAPTSWHCFHSQCPQKHRLPGYAAKSQWDQSSKVIQSQLRKMENRKVYSHNYVCTSVHAHFYKRQFENQCSSRTTHFYRCLCNKK